MLGGRIESGTANITPVIQSPRMEREGGHAEVTEGTTSFLLFELPPQVAEEWLKSQSAQDPLKFKLAAIKGGKRARRNQKGEEEGDEEAVLCTRSCTFALKRVQSSNTVLLGQHWSSKGNELIPAADQPYSTPMAQSDEHFHQHIFKTYPSVQSFYQINASLMSHVELVPILPKLDRLYSMLSAYPYAGQLEDLQSYPHLSNDAPFDFTTSTLERCVQASSEELAQGLRDIHALQINGHWRLLSPTFVQSIFQLISLTVVELDLSFDAIPLAVMEKGLQEDHIESLVLRHVLSMFSTSSTQEAANGDNVFCISTEKVARFMGELCLASFKEDRLKKFLKAWKKSLPDGFAVSLTLLEGLYLLNESALLGRMIKYFPKRALPLDAKARFFELFRTRPKWDKNEFIPFVKDIAPDVKQLDLLFLKYTRSSVVDGITWLTSKIA